MGFKNKFLSFKGQVERLKNVAGVLKAPFTGSKVYGNTPSGTLDKVVEVVSNNPFKTAFVAGTVANIPKAVKLGKTFLSSRLPKGKIVKPGKKGYRDEPGTISPQDVPRSTTTSAVDTPGTIEPSVTAGGTITPTTKPRASRPRRATKRRAPLKRKRARPRARASRARRVRRSPRTRRTRKPRYGTAKQYARKGGKSVKYTKNGQPYIILADGRARFVKGKRR